MQPSVQSALGQSYAGLGQAQRLSSGSTSCVTANFGIDSESATSGVTFTDDPDGASLGERVGSTPYYFLHDALGSVVGVTDASGNLVVKYGYDPYGAVTCSAGTGACSLYGPIRFAGGYLDTHQDGKGPKLYKFGERYYDPTLAR